MIDRLYKLVFYGDIINETLFSNNEYDILLDLRDEEIFDSEWIRVYNELNILKNKISLEEVKKINEIRQKAFTLTYQLTQSSDLASCVSDDFELIAMAISNNYNDKWLNSLTYQYISKHFPCGKLSEISIQLSSII